MTRIIANDRLQKNYVYELAVSEEELAPEFTPDLTPQQMLELGVFGGAYFDFDQTELPATWFKNARLSKSGKADSMLNYFEIDASQPLQVWQAKGWIHPEDPRGWFQWYCRYYLGRRIEGEDERQIKRWRAFSRHAGQVRKYCAPGDMSCRRRQRQALLHWGYDSRKI